MYSCAAGLRFARPHIGSHILLLLHDSLLFPGGKGGHGGGSSSRGGWGVYEHLYYTVASTGLRVCIVPAFWSDELAGFFPPSPAISSSAPTFVPAAVDIDRQSRNESFERRIFYTYCECVSEMRTRSSVKVITKPWLVITDFVRHYRL